MSDDPLADIIARIEDLQKRTTNLEQLPPPAYREILREGAKAIASQIKAITVTVTVEMQGKEGKEKQEPYELGA